LNPFVKTLVRNLIKGIVKSLKLPDENITSINVSLYEVDNK